MAQATIINNELSSAQAGLRVDNPFMSVHYFDRPGPVAGGEMYFGIPGTDPELPQNQKRVYLIQEDGSVLPIAQPVPLSNGGIPTYNGSPAKIAIDGTYSWRVLDGNGAPVYYSPKTSQPALQQIGESRIIEEIYELNGAETQIQFEQVDLSMSTIDMVGPLVDNGPLLKDSDYTIADGSTGVLNLNFTYPSGTKIRARQNAFTNQEETSISSYPYVYDTVADAVAQDLIEGNKVMICGSGEFDDSLSFPLYRVVAGGTGIADGERFINMNNGLQLQSLNHRHDLKNYSEEVVVATVAGGVLTIDVSKGMVQLKDLSESITSIVFANVPEDKSTTVTLWTRQVNGGGFGINFSGFRSASGVSPTISTGSGDINIVVFNTFNGIDWYVYEAGADMQVIP